MPSRLTAPIVPIAMELTKKRSLKGSYTRPSGNTFGAIKLMGSWVRPGFAPEATGSYAPFSGSVSVFLQAVKKTAMAAIANSIFFIDEIVFWGDKNPDG